MAAGDLKRAVGSELPPCVGCGALSPRPDATPRVGRAPRVGVGEAKEKASAVGAASGLCGFSR